MDSAICLSLPLLKVIDKIVVAVSAMRTGTAHRCMAGRAIKNNMCPGSTSGPTPSAWSGPRLIYMAIYGRVWLYVLIYILKYVFGVFGHVLWVSELVF